MKSLATTRRVEQVGSSRNLIHREMSLFDVSGSFLKSSILSIYLYLVSLVWVDSPIKLEHLLKTIISNFLFDISLGEWEFDQILKWKM